MTTTDRILDWATISAAGIDTDRVERRTNPQDTSLELYRIASRDGDWALIFGESTEEPDGWDYGAVEIVDGQDGPNDSYGYAETPTELLAAVRTWADAH